MPELREILGRAGELGVRLAVVLAVIAAFGAVSQLVRPLVRRVLDRRGRPSYTRVFMGLYRVATIVIGSLFALTLAFPSVRVADVLAIFGIVSVAAGFAFKDTFENLLAGVLLLLRDPFKSGDEITVADRAGTVEGVTVRETLLRSPDGQLFFIPNAKVMTDVIEVATDAGLRRLSFSLRLAPDTDFTAVRAVLLAALGSVEGAPASPSPSVLLTDVVDGDVVAECRFWAGSRRGDAATALDRSIAKALLALNEHRIEQPVDELRVTLDDERERR